MLIFLRCSSTFINLFLLFLPGYFEASSLAPSGQTFECSVVSGHISIASLCAMQPCVDRYCLPISRDPPWTTPAPQKEGMPIMMTSRHHKHAEAAELSHEFSALIFHLTPGRAHSIKLQLQHHLFLCRQSYRFDSRASLSVQRRGYGVRLEFLASNKSHT